MPYKLNTCERLELFTQKTDELFYMPLVSNGMGSQMTISWDRASHLLKSQTIQPNEQELRSFLLLFRQFVSDGEPIFLNRVINDCIRFIGSDKIKDELKKAQDHWNKIMKGSLASKIIINDKNISGEYVLDLWINGYYFHNDSRKSTELQRLLSNQNLGLVRMQFLFVVSDLTQIILYVGSVAKFGLREGILKFPDSNN